MSFGIEKAFTKDEVLTNISIYYFTDTIATTLRTYAENTRAMYATGMPKSIWHFTAMPKGGHFAALEQPELFASDVIESVG